MKLRVITNYRKILTMAFLSPVLGPVTLMSEGGHQPPPHPPLSDQDLHGFFRQQLDQLSASGVITQEQADTLYIFFQNKAADRKSNAGKKHFQHNNPRPDIISDLQCAVRLTNEQAKLVADAVSLPGKPR
jgi:hypothetical protein